MSELWQNFVEMVANGSPEQISRMLIFQFVFVGVLFTVWAVGTWWDGRTIKRLKKEIKTLKGGE